MTQADVTNKYLGKILGKLNHLDPDVLTRIATALEGIEKKMGDEDCDDCLNNGCRYKWNHETESKVLVPCDCPKGQKLKLLWKSDKSINVPDDVEPECEECNGDGCEFCTTGSTPPCSCMQCDPEAWLWNTAVLDDAESECDMCTDGNNFSHAFGQVVPCHCPKGREVEKSKDVKRDARSLVCSACKQPVGQRHLNEHIRPAGGINA